MIEFFKAIDISLFYLINVKLANPLFDVVMPFITEPRNWLLVYIITIILLLAKGSRKERIFIVFLLLSVLISDQINSLFLKELFGRLRPCHTMQNIHLLVPCGGGKSFPSSHALNSFTVASIVSFFYKKYRYHIYLLAFLIAFSRISVGVHYPSDVLGGMIFGFILGTFLFKTLEFTLIKAKISHYIR